MFNECNNRYKPSPLNLAVTSRGSEDLPGVHGNIQVLERELLLTQARVEDSGRYYCNATNNKGVDVASAHLTVTGQCCALLTIMICPFCHSVDVSGNLRSYPLFFQV